MARQVVNEDELLSAIEEHLDPSYKLIVLGNTASSSSVRSLHKIWQKYAKVISKARVLIGPHGASLIII